LRMKNRQEGADQNIVTICKKAKRVNTGRTYEVGIIKAPEAKMSIIGRQIIRKRVSRSYRKKYCSKMRRGELTES
jgi:hypothetical protein